MRSVKGSSQARPYLEPKALPHLVVKKFDADFCGSTCSSTLSNYLSVLFYPFLSRLLCVDGCVCLCLCVCVGVWGCVGVGGG